MVSEPTPEVQIDDMRRTLRGCGKTIDRLRQRIRDLEAERDAAYLQGYEQGGNIARFLLTEENKRLREALGQAVAMAQAQAGFFAGGPNLPLPSAWQQAAGRWRAALDPAEGEEAGDAANDL